MPGKRLTDAQRAAIEADIRAGTKSARRIAQDHHRSIGTVVRIGKILSEEQGVPSFDRSKTERATVAARADMAAQRAALAQRCMDEANRLLDEMHQPCMLRNFGGKDNTYNEVEVPEPPFAEKRNIVVSVAVLFDKALKQDAHDSERRGEGESLMVQLVAGLRAADAETPTGDES